MACLTRRLLPLAATLALLAATTRGGQSTSSSDTPTRLPEFLVPGERVGQLELPVPREGLRAPSPNLAADLLALPGVFGQARGADALEPGIRGFSFDRIATSFDGLPLLNASPDRTGAPIALLGPTAAAAITVSKALPSVTLGPVPTGGRIVLHGGSRAATVTANSASLTSSYDAGRAGFSTVASVSARHDTAYVDASLFQHRLGNYIGGGRDVAARYEDHGGSVALGWQHAQHDARLEVTHRRLLRQDTLALPLDVRDTDTLVVALRDRWTTLAPASLQAVSWRIGYASADPYLTNAARPASPLIFSQSVARSAGAGLASTWHPAPTATLVVGADASWHQRRAIRTTSAGRDHIWPDVITSQLGLYAEWNGDLAPGWSLRAGARGDALRSDARAADQPALGRSVREQFIAYNGPAAARVSRHDAVGAANLLLRWQPSSPFSAFLGAGLSAQPAAATERYRAFLNALGGDGRGGNAFELGNPALAAERKLALETGATWRTPWLLVEAAAYAYQIDAFIQRRPIGTTASRVVVFGYRNADAAFCGGELSATWRPADGWSIPLTLARATGWLRATGTGLPDLPPWEASAAVRYAGRLRQHLSALDFGARLAGARTNPAPLDNPLFGTTAGFSVWHLRVGLSLTDTVSVSAGIENLFDRNYTEYLSPPVSPSRPASGSLQPGERVPSPGRAPWLAVKLAW
ncbi:TonB-dependent receptor [Opitutus sp. ER46]|uniref:TonB-dependent receptor n=1 Tax=Opitutus sp. ER46 TaxID=2161864 RepID=UPI000D313D8D|nr:TonB-dependent receptor [Opitutus sp. ER46]PTX95519.1 hypothetical protein DB354_08830 [Opitutus sp. ER46]